MVANSVKRTEKMWQLLLLCYILLIIKLIVFKYPLTEWIHIIKSWQKDVVMEGLDSANFIPFKTIKMYIEYYARLNSFENLFGNILIFVPFGYLMPKAFSLWRRFLSLLGITLLFVAGIETFQLFSAFGAFDVDDFILNCLGSCMGFWFYWMISKVRILR